jgi:hypothetical protein
VLLYRGNRRLPLVSEQDATAFERRYSVGGDPLDAVLAAAEPASPAPGRTTVTERLGSPLVSRKGRGPISADARARVEQARRDAGQPLSAALARSFEPIAAASLAAVRVHRGSASDDAARAVGADAFAIGRDVFFREGAYDDATPGGLHLIAHEVAHTLQPSPDLDALAVTEPGDAREREADELADRFVQALHFGRVGGPVDPPVRALVDRAARGGGGPLPESQRRDLERVLGRDLSSVRLHDDAAAADAAAALDAKAFTVGEHVYFGAGRLAPGTPRGDRLIAHEVVHAVQQRGLVPSHDEPLAVSRPEDAAEREARRLDPAAPVSRLDRAAIQRDKVDELEQEMDDQADPQKGGVLGDAIRRYAHTSGTWIGRQVGAYQAFQTVKNVPVPAGKVLTARLGVPCAEALAITLLKENGFAGAIVQESDGTHLYLTEDFGYRGVPEAQRTGFVASSPPRCAPGVIALVSLEGVVLRPDAGAARPAVDDGLLATSSDASLHALGDPFAEYVQQGTPPDKEADGGHLMQVFQACLRDTALALLERSERDARARKERYTREQALGDHSGVSENELELIRSTARALALIDHSIGELELAVRDPHQNGQAEVGAPTKLTELHRRIHEQRQARKVVLLQYPMLARFPPPPRMPSFVLPGVLDDIADSAKLPDAALLGVLGGEMPGVLDDIATTRTNILAGKLNLWALPQLVDVTIAGLGIHDPAHEKVIRDRAASEKADEELKQTALAVLSVSMGIAAMVVGGPVGAAFAVGAVGAGAWAALDQTEQYFTLAPAANTNADPHRALVDPDSVPGWGWLVVAWAGVLLDGVQALHAVMALGKAGTTTVREAAGAAAKANASRLGVAEDELAKQLRAAAGEIDDGAQVVTEASKAPVAMRLGVEVEIDATLGSDVGVTFSVDAQGEVHLGAVRCGPSATMRSLAEIEDVLEPLREYQAGVDKLRSLRDRLENSIKAARPELQPQPGSAAAIARANLAQLDPIVQARAGRYQGGLVRVADQAEARADAELVRAQLKESGEPVEQYLMETDVEVVGTATRDVNQGSLQAFRERGYWLPDLAGGSSATVGPGEAWASSYYWTKDGSVWSLSRKSGRNAPALTPRFNADGTLKEFVTGRLSTVEAAAEIVNQFPADKQAAFAALQSKCAARGNVLAVVPLKGLTPSNVKFGVLAERYVPGFQDKLEAILTKSLEAKGAADPANLARTYAGQLMDHEITLIQGTSQLRRYGYRAEFLATAGNVDQVDDLHHLISLYLGPDHHLDYLIDMPEKYHQELHSLMDQVVVDETTLLDPAALDTSKVNVEGGAAVLFTDGGILYDPLKPGEAVALPPSAWDPNP